VKHGCSGEGGGRRRRGGETLDALCPDGPTASRVYAGLAAWWKTKESYLSQHDGWYRLVRRSRWARERACGRLQKAGGARGRCVTPYANGSRHVQPMAWPTISQAVRQKQSGATAVGFGLLQIAFGPERGRECGEVRGAVRSSMADPDVTHRHYPVGERLQPRRGFRALASDKSDLAETSGARGRRHRHLPRGVEVFPNVQNNSCRLFLARRGRYHAIRRGRGDGDQVRTHEYWTFAGC